MEKNNQARKHKSKAIARLRKGIAPEIRLAVEAKMTLAARIDDLITSKGWSKSEFARKVDQEPSVITKWLSGTHNFTQDTLADIAAVLGVKSVQELYGKLENKIIYEKEFALCNLNNDTTQDGEYMRSLSHSLLPLFSTSAKVHQA